MKNRDNNIFRAFRIIYNCDKWAFLRRILWTFLESTLPLANLYVLKLLIDKVTSESGNGEYGLDGVLVYVALFCILIVLGRFVAAINEVNEDSLQQKLVDYIANMLHRKSMELDLSFYDNSSFHDTLHRAQQEASTRPIQVLSSSMSFIGAAISITGTVAMLASASWWVLPVMAVAVLPSFAVRLTKARRLYKFHRDKTRYKRRAAYLSGLITRREFSKELRAYSLGELFSNEYAKIRRELVSMILSISKKVAGYDIACAVVEGVALFFITVLLLRGTIEGVYTIGSFVMLFEAFRRGLVYLQKMVGSIANLYDNKLFISNLYEFFNIRPKIVSPSSPIPFPSNVESVEFDHITFAYPEQDHHVLENYCLKAEKGKITRIEGENGFGKTTLIKLLLRLYDPLEGAVRINGVDIRRFDIKQLRHGISVVFQDYFQFCFTVRENIEFGDISNPSDEKRLHEAASLSCAESIIKKLPKGYDTPLGRQFDDGEELSMGQLQRIAIARLLYSGAGILAFDEPTAWMDKGTRAEFTSNLEQICKDRVVLLILHQ